MNIYWNHLREFLATPSGVIMGIAFAVVVVGAVYDLYLRRGVGNAND